MDCRRTAEELSSKKKVKAMKLTFYSHLTPGGKIEISEGRAQFFCDDGTWPADSSMRKWMDEFNRIGSVMVRKTLLPFLPSYSTPLSPLSIFHFREYFVS